MSRLQKRYLPFLFIGVFGVVIIIRTAMLGGGFKLATGYLVGVAFIAYAVARYMLSKGRG